MLDVPNLLMEDLPDEPQQAMGDSPDRQLYSLPYSQTLKQNLEITAFRSYGRPCQLV
jgi:hypothetical protein